MVAGGAGRRDFCRDDGSTAGVLAEDGDVVGEESGGGDHD